MILIIAGSRDYPQRVCYQQLNDLCSDWLIKTKLVIHGACRGPDLYGGLWAKRLGIEVREFPANWNANGIRDHLAGFKRNISMAKQATHLIAFWDGKSSGTKHMIDTAKAAGLEVRIIYPHGIDNAI